MEGIGRDCAHRWRDRSSLNYYRAIHTTADQNRARAARQLPMPVLAVGGAASRGHSVAADITPIADDVTALTIPNCGHYVPEEAPQELLESLRSFLS